MQPEVVHVNAFSEVTRRVNKSMHGDEEAYYKVPDNREEAAQYLLLYEMSLPFGWISIIKLTWTNPNPE